MLEFNDEAITKIISPTDQARYLMDQMIKQMPDKQNTIKNSMIRTIAENTKNKAEKVWKITAEKIKD